MTKLVGILNITPDSFSDGGDWNNPEQAAARVDQLFLEGADIVDIGAESTRPGAQEVSIEDEWARLNPLLKKLRKTHDPARFSIDTRHGEIAQRVVHTWSSNILINDVTGLSDRRMIEVVSLNGLRVVLSHLPFVASGSLARAHQEKMTSQEAVYNELMLQYEKLHKWGVDQDKLILDPGIGFGKSPELNQELIHFGSMTELPVMIGYSRKRFLGERRFDPDFNVSLGRLAIASGASYLRVHDVAAHHELLN